MPEDAGAGVGAGVDLFQVSPANAAGGDLDQQFAGTDGWARGTVSSRISLMPR